MDHLHFEAGLFSFNQKVINAAFKHTLIKQYNTPSKYKD